MLTMTEEEQPAFWKLPNRISLIKNSAGLSEKIPTSRDNFIPKFWHCPAKKEPFKVRIPNPTMNKRIHQQDICFSCHNRACVKGFFYSQGNGKEFLLFES